MVEQKTFNLWVLGSSPSGLTYITSKPHHLFGGVLVVYGHIGKSVLSSTIKFVTSSINPNPKFYKIMLGKGSSHLPDAFSNGRRGLKAS